MLDRLLFWIVVLAPPVTVLLAVFHGRWQKLPRARRGREILLTAAVVLGALTAFLAYDLTRHDASEVTSIHFQNPYYLLALLPLYLLLLAIQWKSLAGLSRGRTWLSFLLRSAILVLLMLALSGLQMVVEKDVMTVLFALDRSKSVAPPAAAAALEYVEKALPAKPADDKVGLLVFGGKAASEVWPKTTFVTPDLKHLKSEIDDTRTDIQIAFRRARATFEEGSSKRLVLFTDGRQTEGDALAELKYLKESGVDVWIVPLGRDNAAEMLVEEVKVPAQLKWEQPFDARVFIRSNVDTRARVTLKTGEQLIVYPEPVQLRADRREAVVFPNLKLRRGGPHQIEALIEPLDPRDDTLAENNHAFTFTDVETDSRVLILTSDLAEVEHLEKALEGEKLDLDIRSGASLPENPEEYRRYDCIVLANLGRGFLSEQQMSVIESCVKDQGAGLVMIGGDQSFGAGGYLGTPIERALPVSMELRNQRIMPSGALGIVLHTCEFADGNSWGKKISKAAINVLSPEDYAGLLYYGMMGGNNWLFRPTKVSRKGYMFKMIDGCEPWDMPDLDGIVSMCVNELIKLPRVSLKHCIIITDGDPSPPSNATIAAAVRGKVTVSVITIFPHGGGDIGQMKNLAAQTGGRYYNPTDPRKLPLIFVKEAAVVRKNLIYRDDKGIPVSLGTPAEVLRDFGSDFPSVRAFVVTSLKSLSEQHLYATVEGEKTPILARWRYGLGKSVAFTSDATNNWAPDYVAWARYQRFWANLFRWVCRQRMPSKHTVWTTIEGDTARVMVEALDEKGEYINFAKLLGTSAEPGIGAEDLDAATHQLNFQLTAPGRYEATFPLRKQGAYTITVTDMSDAGKPASIVTGMAHSYSREFLHLTPDEALLTKLGDAAGRDGQSNLKQLDELLDDPLNSGVFLHNLPPVKRPDDLFWPLLWFALLLFPLDVAVRRLHVEPGRVAERLGAAFAFAFGFLRRKKEELADAAAKAADAATADRRAPPPLMPQGPQSRAAQSRFEQAGGSAEAQGMDLKPKAQPDAKPKAVGGTKISEADDAASEYTRNLLRAKRRAKKKDENS
ncbi:MAG: glutamine amidotransferase [Planctomycetota bacterium]|nr:glutamine amidotransferase [Planctomycetota bacterium]